MKPKLTIGMAAASDFDGPAFTIQSLRLYHPDVIDECEILVVDNTPETKIGDRLKRFCAKAGVRYIPFPEPQGTAAPRGHIFEQAESENVLCLDSHVLIIPGAIERLIKWMVATGDSPWREDDHDRRDLLSGPIIWDDLEAAYAGSRAMATHFQPTWGAGMWGQWALDERAIDDGAPPFEIEMMGMGMFACRRDAFPGFNDRMIGFGGEEGYLHEKVRRNGGRNLCLPWLRWWHRFNEFVPGAAPYVATVEDKAWNYCVGWSELGWDLSPIREHFATIMPVEMFDRIAEAAELGDALPPHRVGRNDTQSTTTSDCGCQGNGAASSHDVASEDFAVHAEQLRSFIERIGEEGVVYEHSADGSPATVALAELHPGKVLSFSPRHGKGAFEAFREHGRERVTLVSSAPKAPIYEADLIVLSGYTDSRELAPHLETAGEKSRRLIAIGGSNQPDTTKAPSVMTAMRTFLREHPEWSVVSHSQVATGDSTRREGNGLTILSSDDRDKPKLPGKIEMAANFAQAVAEHVANGAAKVDQTILERRLEICTVCEHRNEDRCTVCGCFLAEKAAWRTSDCPLGKWEASDMSEKPTNLATLGSGSLD